MSLKVHFFAQFIYVIGDKYEIIDIETQGKNAIVERFNVHYCVRRALPIICLKELVYKTFVLIAINLFEAVK